MGHDAPEVTRSAARRIGPLRAAEKRAGSGHPAGRDAPLRREGLRGTRTAEIAAAAGVTERTLFRYFPSKESLYRRVMFPALLAAAVPRELTDTGELFARGLGILPALAPPGAEAARRRGPGQSAPQFRLLLAGADDRRAPAATR